MGIRSWIHFLYSAEVVYYLEKFVRENYSIVSVGFAKIDGTIQSHDGQIFGQKGKKSLVLLTQSDGNHVVERMVNLGITDFFHTVLLDNLNSEEITHTEHGWKLRKARYLTEDQYYREIEKLPEYDRNDSGLNIGALKKFLKNFHDSNRVDLWREIVDSEYGTVISVNDELDAFYESNGNLTFKISTSVDDLERTFKDVKVNDIFRKAGIFYKPYKPDVLNVYGETKYYEHEYENIKTAKEF